MLGIENLKEGVLALCEIGAKFDEALADGKITTWEAVGIGVTTIKKVPGIIANGPEIIDEFKDLDDQEKQELINYIEINLDLDNYKVENIIKKGIHALSSMEDFISAFSA